MKPGFLTQILVFPVTAISKSKALQHAESLEFTMYAYNNIVYSTSDDAPLFQLTDLVDYNYGSNNSLS